MYCPFQALVGRTPGKSAGAQGEPCACHWPVTRGLPGKAWGWTPLQPATCSAPRPGTAIWTVTPLAPETLPTTLSGLGSPSQIPG